MALTPDDVVNKTFQPTKFREGYDQDEVDDFLDEVVNTLRGIQQENDELKVKLSACENRVGELSRAGAAGGTASLTKVPKPQTQPDPEPEPAPEPEPEPEPTPVVPQPVLPAAQAPAPAVTSSVGGAGPEAATGMLALAQKLHDEHVRSGEEKRDQLIGEAKEHAGTLVREAESKKSQTLGALEQERSLLERKIDELRGFEREYRTRLKSYLETQLKDLENKGSLAPGRPGESGLQDG